MIPLLIAVFLGIVIVYEVIGASNVDNKSILDTVPVNLPGVSAQKIQALANAISQAEGFGPAGNLPTRTNNPGDMELGDLGNGTDAGKTIFSSLIDGWQHLNKQVWLMLSGNSRVYSLSDTFSDVAQKYTGGDNASSWASNVASALGLSVSNTLEDYANG